MPTLAQAHKQRTEAARQSSGTAPAAVGGVRQQMLAALWADMRALKDTKSIQLKVEKKRDMLPKYAPYVEGILEGGKGDPDDLLMTVMAWRLDVGDIGGALEVADYAIANALPTPDRFRRDTPSLIAEQVAEEALAVLDPPGGAPADLGQDQAAELLEHLRHAMDLTRNHDMHDQIRAKLRRALGYAHAALSNVPQALTELREALSLNERVGVKKDIERLERRLRDAAKAKAQEQPEAQATA
jgi:hypothetical protein